MLIGLGAPATIVHYIFYVTGLLTACLAVYSLGVAFYNAYIHPASKFPGPKLWSAFHIFKDMTCAKSGVNTTSRTS